VLAVTHLHAAALGVRVLPCHIDEPEAVLLEPLYGRGFCRTGWYVIYSNKELNSKPHLTS
jgi:hypothetical protein